MLADTHPATQHLRSCIQKVATGPAYSKPLSYEEARKAMHYILDGEIDPVHSAIYLIALRMKRETDEENRGTLQALIEQANITTSTLPFVLDMADPYDGFMRCIPASTFLPAVLASLEVPTVLHGLQQLGPKYGVTHHQILKESGINTQLTPKTAAQQLEKQGWVYLDQSQFAPKLHHLVPLRHRMVKRQILNTVENLIGPIRGQQATHHFTGYVHKAYPPIYESLARQSGFQSALFMRGVEGGVIPSLQQAGRYFAYNDDTELHLSNINPKDLDIQAEQRAVPIPASLGEAFTTKALAQTAASLGIAALQGEPGLTRESLVYSAAVILVHLRHYGDLPLAAKVVRQRLDNGKAWACFEAQSFH